MRDRRSLRVVRAGRRPFHLVRRGYTLIVESQPFARMMDLLKVDVHPPLYYLLLRMWISVFGSDVMALRAMS